MKRSDKIIFRQIKKGNKNAFDALFKNHYKSLCMFSMKFVRSKDQAEDIVQEVFINLWNKAENIEIEGTISSYLFTSVRNRALNLIKSEKTRKDYESESIRDVKETNSSSDESSNESVSKIIDSKVEELPEKCKNVFIMSKKEGLTYDEIADYLGISVKTVENQMGIALRKLREEMQKLKVKI